MAAPATSDRFVEVPTAAGVVRGRWRGGAGSSPATSTAVFLGIPFAEPPIGDLRFAAPAPHQSWTGVREALEFGPTPQRGGVAEMTLIPEPSVPGDATLSVNVFTPSPSPSETGGLPVLVYIHGGGYVSGSQASPWYDGASFNRDGVVVVTLSYRLGFDGFGWISDAPANRALLDWLLALEWVQQNIGEFGGNPHQVTIAGQSAGGGAVLTLLAMPGAQHLFQRVYSISPTTNVTTPERAEQFGRQLAELAGVEPTRAGLGALSESRVLELQNQISSVGPAAGDADPLAGLISLVTDGLVLCPIVDGDLLPSNFSEAFQAGTGSDKPLVVGATDNEFNMAVNRVRDTLSDSAPGDLLRRAGLADPTVDAYLADHAELDAAGVLGQYLTDAMFRVGIVQVAEARGAAPTWVYRFAWRSPTFGEAIHCIDVPFFFDCLDAYRVSVIAGDAPPQAVADEVHAAAVSFVVNSEPGWPAWSGADRVARIFDTPSSTLPDGYAGVRSLLAAAG